MIQFERITIELISYWRSHFQFHFIDSYWCRKGKHQTNQIEIFHSFRHLLHRMEENKKDDDTRHQGFARGGHEAQTCRFILSSWWQSFTPKSVLLTFWNFLESSLANICLQDVANLQSFLHSCLRTISLISHLKRHHCICFEQITL